MSFVLVRSILKPSLERQAFTAVYANHPTDLVELLEDGVDPNAVRAACLDGRKMEWDNSLLSCAIRLAHYDCAQHLLFHGANPQVVDQYGSVRGVLSMRIADRMGKASTDPQHISDDPYEYVQGDALVDFYLAFERAWRLWAHGPMGLELKPHRFVRPDGNPWVERHWTPVQLALAQRQALHKEIGGDSFQVSERKRKM